VADLDVTPNGPRSWVVEISDGDRGTRHLVSVPDSLLDALALDESQSELLIRESFAFLLEREPATSILSEFSLEVIGQYFPEYLEEVGRRLS
jgi:hypothetical protein